MISRIKKHKRSRVRKLIRGFRAALNNNDLAKIRQIERLLIQTKINFNVGLIEKLLFRDLQSDSEIIVRQYILDRYAGLPLRRAIFRYISAPRPLVFPLPNVWQNVLIESGISVNRLLSSILWCALNIRSCIHALQAIGRTLSRGIISLLQSKTIVPEPHAYFDKLHQQNIPNPKYSNGLDICSWYTTWSGRNHDVHCIGHNLSNYKDVYVNNFVVQYMPIPGTSVFSYVQLLKFIIWLFYSTLAVLIGLILGRWWNSCLLYEASLSTLIATTPPNFLARDYLFHYSRSIYRPMWTYSAEKMGSRVLCYFYSTYSQPSIGDDAHCQLYEWGPSTWPLYLVWNQVQSDILKRDISPKINISIVGPIHFTDGQCADIQTTQKCIAVFDIQPHRKSIAYGISTSFEYYYKNRNFHSRFINDIYDVISAQNIIILLKSKRYIADFGDKAYETTVNNLLSKGNMIRLPDRKSVV